MNETAVVQFLIALIAPFMVAYGIGYFIRRSIKLIVFMLGMFFFVAGVLWYAGVISSFSGIQDWIEGVMKIGYDKTQQLSDQIGATVDKKAEGSAGQMTIILGISSFFTGMLYGLFGNKKDKALRISAD